LADFQFSGQPTTEEFCDGNLVDGSLLDAIF
jgi:hypothetical protein